MRGLYKNPGSLPSFDHCGYEVAVQMVAASLQKWSYSETHKQWDTTRRFRSCYSNQVWVARDANSNPIVVVDGSGKSYQRIGRDTCGSLWFSRFAIGCRKRIGQDWQPNQAISIEVMHQLLKKTEGRIRIAADTNERSTWIISGGYFCICFVLSLRSPEGLMADLEGLIRFYDENDDNVIGPLVGRFKGDHHAKQHLLTSRGVTGLGTTVEGWIKQILAVHRVHGRMSGPAFVNDDGYQTSTSEMNDTFLKLLWLRLLRRVCHGYLVST